MNIKNFEQRIEPKIVDRGFSYYEDEHIEDFEQIEKGEFSATVLGSEAYTVFVKLEEDHDIVEHACNCPYDWGDYCKHLVAVLFRIRESKAHLSEPDGTGKIGTIKKELANYSQPELQQLIVDVVKRNRDFQSELLWHLGHEEEYL